MIDDVSTLTFDKIEENNPRMERENIAELYKTRDKKLVLMQEEMLELLKRIHKLCMTEDVKYSVYGGTQLGGVRDRGFISWDNDADIILRREEYNKLLCVLKKISLGQDMYFDDTLDRIPKFVLHRLGRPAVYIDVFIYDYISENPFFQNLKIYLTLLLAAITKSAETIEVIRVKRQLTGLKYTMFYIVYFLCRPFSIRKKIDFWNWFCERKLVGKKTTIFCSNSPKPHMKKDIHLAKNISSYVNIPFEDTYLMSFENYAEILQGLYGFDYMIPKKNPETEFDAHELIRQLLERKYTC